MDVIPILKVLSNIPLVHADDHFEFLDRHPQFFEDLFFIAQVIRPDDQLDHGTRRVAQIRAVGIFVIPRKVLNDGFAIEQEFECLPVDGKMFVLGHNAYSAKNRGANFVANRDPPCTR